MHGTFNLTVGFWEVMLVASFVSIHEVNHFRVCIYSICYSLLPVQKFIGYCEIVNTDFVP